MGKLRLLWVSHDREFVLGAIHWLSTHLGIEPAGISHDAGDALHRILTVRPELVLIDEATPGLDVLDTAMRIGGLSRPPRVVVLSRLDRPAPNLAMIGAAADAVVPRAEFVLELQPALERLFPEWGRSQGAQSHRQDQLLVRDVVRSASTLVCVLAPGGTVLFANPATSAMAGCSPDEIIGRQTWELLHAGPDPGFGPELVARLAHESVVRMELTMARRSGATRRVAWEWTARRSSRNACIALIGVGQDISVAERAEEMIRRLGEQSLQLEDRMLRALEMDSAGRVAAGISRELHSLVATLLSSCRDLRERIRPEDPLREASLELVRDGEHAESLARQLLACGFHQGEPAAPMVLNDCVAGAAGTLRRVLGEKIELTMRLVEGLGSVCADEAQLRQVLLNLAIHAREAMPEGGRLTIETSGSLVYDGAAGGLPPDGARFEPRKATDAGRYVVLRVLATGRGMNANLLPRVLGPLPGARGRNRSAGLGLSIVQGIVQQAGGSIEVQGNPGGGGTFTIRLPRLEAAQVAADRAAGDELPA